MDINDFADATLKHHHNENYNRNPDYSIELSSVLDKESCDNAYHTISKWDGYAPSPLVSLFGLAKKIGVADILYKHEGERFGLGSFKALGGAYSVLQLLIQEVSKATSKQVGVDEIISGEYADIIREITVITATDGNHGRSVAWGAQKFGCNSFIYMHAGVSSGRAKAVEAFGATVVWVDGNYDQSVHEAAEAATKNAWFVVSDTSYEGYTELPKNVMAGYTVMTTEIIQQLPKNKLPTHVFVQGGVGGLAGAVCSHLWQSLGPERPRFVIVEPDRADCLFQSGLRGEMTDVSIQEETVMAGLSCGEVSSLAWQILLGGTNDFMTIEDELIAPTMKLLAKGIGDDQRLVAGESAVAGLAGAIAARMNTDLRSELGLTESSRILVFGTEGATDPAIYEKLVGLSPADVEV
ncbi:MAG: diaminopropionate ammonia-lyase [Sneathiella sp.]